MQLKKLELYGFKSFSDRTVVELDKGITGIVGPNGSGKSNIVDSVMWVLGEQSVKNLRGSKMDDVVFKGSDKRKPNGFAEVILTLDNTDHVLDTEYNEVQISRRLYRSGESRYCINGEEKRLKDITHLFMDSGVGKYGYSIIGQGKVSEVLNATPEGRRYIFDEAAGIMKYKIRREESQKNLFLTQENISRANDLIYELEQNLPQLKIAAEKAEKYIKVAEHLKKSETTRFVLLHDRYKATEDRLQKQIELLQNDINQNEASKQKEIQKLDDINSRHDSVQEQCDKLRSNRMESIRTVERLKGELKYSVDRLAQLDRDEKINNDNTSRYVEEAQSLISFIESEEKRRDVYAKSKEENDLALAKQIDTVEKIKQEYSDLSEQLKFAQEKNAVYIDNENSARLKLAELSTKREMLTIQGNTENMKLAEEEKRLGETEAITKASADNLAELKKKVDNLKAELTKAYQDFEKANEEYSNFASRYETLAKTAESEKSRLATLNELKESMEAFNNSTKAVLRLKSSGGEFSDEIVGAVSEIIRVDKDYETAIEVALGGAVQNIVTKTDIGAKKIIEYLRNNRLGYATFLPMNSVQGRTVNDNDRRTLQQRGFLGIASEIIKYDKAYTNIIQNLLGRVVIAENMDSAIAIARASKYMYKIVTLEGDVINPYGSISGGSRGKSNVSNVFSRSREIDELEAKLKEHIDELRKIADGISSYKQKRVDLKAAFDEKQDAYHKAEIEYSSAKKSDEFVGAQLDSAKNSIEQHKKQYNRILAEQKEADDEIEKINSQIDKYKQLLLGADKDMGELASNENDARDRLTREEMALTDLRLKQMECDSKLEVVTASLEEQINKRNERLQLVDELRRANKQIYEERETLSKKSAEYEATVAKLEQSEQDEIRVLEECEESLKELDKLKKAREEQIRSIESVVLEIGTKLHDYDMEKARVLMESENLQSRMWEVYEVSLGDALEAEKEEGDLEELNRKIRDLKADITRMGPINPEAPEQYETQSARYTKLCKERDDLIAAGNDIEKLIAEITKEMRTKFNEEFQVINEYFTEMFKKLFNGGTARLELCDSDDVLEAGIDIIAQPPGKKLQNISLMSGGEKALIAIALVFALLKRRPAPFCILDEIDTALDEKNVYNLAELVKSFTDTMQFIIISHRKGTMEASNALYGVSMEEKGVSSLVSVRFEDAQTEN